MFRRMRDWHRLLNVMGYIETRRFLPADVREWYERTMAVAKQYIGQVRCVCPECQVDLLRDVGIRLIGRVLVGVYKAIKYGPPEDPDARR